MEVLLKTLVGSRAHKLHNGNSDYDYRGVFVVPTDHLLMLNGRGIKQTNWMEGTVDDTSWEVGRFLWFATKCNPSILEVLKAPVISTTEWGDRIQNLFPHIWNSAGVANACLGYASNQRKKFVTSRDDRAHKYAVAYLRTLYMAHQILRTGDFDLDLSSSPIYEQAIRWKRGEYTYGEVMQTCRNWEIEVEDAYEDNPDKRTDMGLVNDLLLDIRHEFMS